MPSVLITGAGKRLGRAFALGFARNGWDVIVHYNSSRDGALKTVEEIKALGRNAIAVIADVADKKELQRAFEKGADKCGIPDCVVSNAGVLPMRSGLQEISAALWQNTFDINVTSHLYLAQIYDDALKSFKKESGRFVTLASLGGREIWKERIPYNTSKAATIQLSKALARELAPRVAVNCVCPGAILVAGEPNANEKMMVPADRIPMQRYGTAEDVFDAVYFFATCSPYITAQTLTVDGGYHDGR
ncbi:MAG TPA: SDR family oxidoreductase [Patescibacteria group bacterium]|nr:SDR family oxidoreductase [Patescibacteria group bacterium]